jgi:ABC-type glycerol-3-phosphate transport system permease component
VLVYSLSDPSSAIRGVYLWPVRPTLYNYRHVFENSNLAHAALVSVARTFIGGAVTVVGCSVFAYALSREKTPFRKFIYRAGVVTMYLNAGMIPWYLTMRAYGLQNNFLLYIVPSIVVVFYLILAKTYFEQMPKELEESAKMDGADHFVILFKIILPLSLPILATIFIFAAVGQWNTWMDNFLLNTKPELETLQLVLLKYIRGQEAAIQAVMSERSSDALERLRQIKVTPRSIQMTITTIVVLPIFFVYPFVQKYFMKALLLGAIKG